MHLSTAQTTGDIDEEVELRIKPGFAPPLMELRVVEFRYAGCGRAPVRSFIEKGLISKFAVPERVEFVDTLPLTSVGKIDKKKLRAKYRDQLPAKHVPAAAE